MSDSLIMSMYEEGRSVKEIAEVMGTAPSEVNALLAKTDDTQTVQVARQEKHVRDLRRIRSLADGMTKKYLETLNAVKELFVSLLLKTYTHTLIGSLGPQSIIRPQIFINQNFLEP